MENQIKNIQQIQKRLRKDTSDDIKDKSFRTFTLLDILKKRKELAIMTEYWKDYDDIRSKNFVLNKIKKQEIDNKQIEVFLQLMFQIFNKLDNKQISISFHNLQINIKPSIDKVSNFYKENINIYIPKLKNIEIYLQFLKILTDSFLFIYMNYLRLIDFLNINLLLNFYNLKNISKDTIENKIKDMFNKIFFLAINDDNHYEKFLDNYSNYFIKIFNKDEYKSLSELNIEKKKLDNEIENVRESKNNKDIKEKKKKLLRRKIILLYIDNFYYTGFRFISMFRKLNQFKYKILNEIHEKIFEKNKQFFEEVKNKINAKKKIDKILKIENYKKDIVNDLINKYTDNSDFILYCFDEYMDKYNYIFNDKDFINFINYIINNITNEYDDYLDYFLFFYINDIDILCYQIKYDFELERNKDKKYIDIDDYSSSNSSYKKEGTIQDPYDLLYYMLIDNSIAADVFKQFINTDQIDTIKEHYLQNNDNNINPPNIYYFLKFYSVVDDDFLYQYRNKNPENTINHILEDKTEEGDIIVKYSDIPKYENVVKNQIISQKNQIPQIISSKQKNQQRKSQQNQIPQQIIIQQNTNQPIYSKNKPIKSSKKQQIPQKNQKINSSKQPMIHLSCSSSSP